MSGSIPGIVLNNGVEIPQVGLGVFQVPGDQTKAAVATALEAGYRSIDTAAIYGNEEGVGSAIAESGLPRDELFVTSKLWFSELGYDATLRAYDVSLAKLGLDMLDMYLIHWPAPASDRYLDSWRALERLLRCQGSPTAVCALGCGYPCSRPRLAPVARVCNNCSCN